MERDPDWQRCGTPIDDLLGTDYETAMLGVHDGFAGILGGPTVVSDRLDNFSWTENGIDFVDATWKIRELLGEEFQPEHFNKPGSYVANLNQFILTGTTGTTIVDNFREGPDYWAVNERLASDILSSPGIFGFGENQGQLYGTFAVGRDLGAIGVLGGDWEVLYTNPAYRDTAPVFTENGDTLIYSETVPDQGDRLRVIHGFDKGNRTPLDLGYDQDSTPVAFVGADYTTLEKDIIVTYNWDLLRFEACVDENSAPAETIADGALYTVNIGGDITTVTDGVPVIVDCNEPINATWVRTNEGLPVTGFATLGGEQMLVTDNHTTPDYYSTGELHSWTCDAMDALAHRESYHLIVEVGNDAGTTKFNGTINIECPQAKGTLGEGAYAIGDGTISIPEGVSVDVEEPTEGDTDLSVTPENNGEYTFALNNAAGFTLGVDGETAYLSMNGGAGEIALGVNDISTFDATGDINTTYTWTTAGNLSVTCHDAGTEFQMTTQDSCPKITVSGDTGGTDTNVTGTTQDANGNRAGDTSCNHTAPFPIAPINSVIAAAMVGFMAFLRRSKA